MAKVEKTCEFQKAIPSMGSFFEVQLPGLCNSEMNEDLTIKIKNRLDSIESEMSLYQSQSAISRLNRTGSVDDVSLDFIRNIEFSIEHQRKTAGYFNIAILPILQEIQTSFKETNRPPKDLSRFKSLLDLKKIKIENRKVSFAKSNMKVTLDGIAKGYAVDLIAEYIESQNVKNYLLNFSGNMRWRGRRVDGEFWRIAIWDFLNQKKIDLPAMDRGAIASSGAEYNFISEDRRWHHIINPKTYRPPVHILVAAAIGPSAAICDILSTTLFIWPDKQRRKILPSEYPEYKYWVMESDGRIESTIL